MQQPSFPPQFTQIWPGHEASKSVQFEIDQGYLENGNIDVAGSNIVLGSGRIRNNKIKFQIQNWVPGKTMVEIVVPSMLGGGHITKRQVELNILSPFRQWRQYEDPSLPEIGKGDQCLPFSTGLRDRLRELADRSGKHVLWLSGAPGSGKSFLLDNYVFPALHAVGKCKLVRQPRERWQLFSETTESRLLAVEHRFDPSLHRYLPSHLVTYFEGNCHGALLIDHAYDDGALPDFVWELVLTVSQSEAFHVESFLLVVVDVFPIMRRLRQIQNSDPDAYRFLEPTISGALNNGLIEDVQLDPLDMDQILEVSRTVRNKSFSPLQARQLMEMTGGNRYLLASVLDGWTNLYSDTSSPGDVPSSVHLPEAGQRLFDRVCRTLAITPEKANEFISWLQQKKSRRWIASSPNIDNRLKYWVEGGIVLRQSEAYSKSRYLVPRAFHDVVFAMGI